MLININFFKSKYKTT